MKAELLNADGDPKPDFHLRHKDIEGKLTHQGRKWWRNPHLEICEKDELIPDLEAR